MIGASLGQWRARIGLFHTKSISKESKDYDCLLIVSQLSNILYLIGKPFVILFIATIILLCHGTDY